jgi:hypothetical protein
MTEYGLTGRRRRKGFAEVAKEDNKNVLKTFLLNFSAPSAKPLRLLRPVVRFLS